ncbi:MAG: hypothetical protein IPK34_09050 [Ramlibacter sp.]|nr:hypothetical protein [Ramlibacter sp.]
MLKNSVGASLIAALSATGCALVYEGKYDWHDGWREAQVLQIGSAADIERPRFSDCRGQMTSQQLAMSQFAVLSYTHMARKRHRVVPLQAGQSGAVGDQVYMQITSCDGPLVARKSRA